MTLSNEEIEALETTVKMWLVSPQAESVSKVIQNLLQRTKNNNEQSEQMEIAREVMKQDSECLRNLSKNNDDTTKNSES
jgi:type IV secretory pathway ATPase VirB11/archaellum biosynthesis ATPase